MIEFLLLTVAINQSVPPEVLYGICKTESNLRPTVVNYYDGSSHSYGLCQLKLATARHLGFKGKVKELLNPVINATYAAKYYRYQYNRYNNKVLAISAYNKGNSKFPITNKRYVDKVLKHAGQFYNAYSK